MSFVCLDVGCFRLFVGGMFVFWWFVAACECFALRIFGFTFIALGGSLVLGLVWVWNSGFSGCGFLVVSLFRGDFVVDRG